MQWLMVKYRNIEIGQNNVPLNAWVLDDTVFSV